jgi:hypothetical protein
VTRASSRLGSNLANNASARKNGNVVGVVAGVHFRRGKTNPEKAGFVERLFPKVWLFPRTRKPLAGYGSRIGFIDSRIHGLIYQIYRISNLLKSSNVVPG